MHLRRLLPLAAALTLAFPAAAVAAPTGHLPLVEASIPVLGGLAGLAGSVFHAIGGAVLGAFSWTIGLASKFLLTTVAAIVRMLIPHSWVHKGLQIMQWIVSVPNYAGQVATPGGGHAYGFAGINALRDLFMWLGIALAPLSLVYATSRAMIGEGDPVAIPVLRIAVTGAVIVSYPYWWGQVAALADQVTNAILTVPQVSDGLYKLMAYAVDGVALGGWQLIDLGLMGAIGLELLGLIFLKVVLILIGALLYATGPVMIGLVPTRSGSALARAWASAVVTLFGIGIAWATVFAVGALLINDAGTAGPLIGGQSAFGSLAGGLLLAVAGVATLWLCLKVTKEAGGLLRVQLSGALTLAGTRGGSSTTRSRGSNPLAGARERTSPSALRDYGQRAGNAAAAANRKLGDAGPVGAALAGGLSTAGRVGRVGLAGTASGAVMQGARRAMPAVERTVSRAPAGSVAARMARAGTASWVSSRPTNNQSGPSYGRRNGAAGDGSPTRPGGPARSDRRASGARGASNGGATSLSRQPASKAQTNRAGERPTPRRPPATPAETTAQASRPDRSRPAPPPPSAQRQHSDRQRVSPPPKPSDPVRPRDLLRPDRADRADAPKPATRSSKRTTGTTPKRSWRRPRSDRKNDR